MIRFSTIRCGALAAFVAAAALSANTASAQFTWDADTGTTGPQDGSGTWSTSNANWWNGTTDVVWSTTSAVFGTGTATGSGTAGTVTLGSNVTASNITFNAPFSGTYTIDLAGRTLALSSNAALTFNANATIADSVGGGSLSITSLGSLSGNNSALLTISAKVTGSTNMYTGNAGSLTLTNDANDFTGLLGKQNGGNLTISSIRNSGVASAAGAGSRVQVGYNSTLVYTGGGDTTNRTLELIGDNSPRSASIINSGSGALVWTGTVSNTASAGGAMYVYLGGSNNNNNEIQGAFADNGTNVLFMTKQDAGKWILSGANTYTGTTSVTGGTLQIGNGGTTGSLSGSSSISVSSGATLAFARSNTITQGTDFTSVISGSGNLTQLGSGTLVLTGSNTYTGTTTISAGVLSLSGSGALATGPVAITGSGATFDISGASGGRTIGMLTGTAGSIVALGANTLTVGNSTSGTFAGGIGGTGGLTKLGTGTLALSGSSAYSGLTTLSAGQLTLNNSSAIGTGTFTIAGGSLDNTSGGAVTLATNNVQNWSGDFAFVGTNPLNLGTGAVTLGATRQVTVTSSTLTVGGVIGDGGSAYGLTKAGAGTLSLTAANTYTGTTTLNAGVVNLGSAETAGTSGPLGKSAAANAGSIVLAGGTLQYSSVNQNDYSGRFSTAANQRYNVDTNGQSVTWATALASSGGSLTKVGSGTLALTAANTYTGTTTIGGGMLRADVADVASTSGALGNGGSITFTGGTLQFTANSAGADYSSRIVGSTGAIAIDTNGQNVLFNTALASTNTGGLTKLGSGTLTVRATTAGTTYTGTTTINGGALNITSVDLGYMSSSTFLINNASTLLLSATTNRMVWNLETVVFDSAGGGTFRLNNGNILLQNTGTFRTTGGLQNVLSSSNSAFFNGQNGAGTITFDVVQGTDATADLVVTALLSGLNIIKTGSGTLSVRGGNSDYPITVSQGTFDVGGSGQLNSGAFSKNITNSGVFRYSSSAAQTISGTISGTGSLVQMGSGTLTLSALNTYSGATTVSAGSLVAGGTAALGAQSGNITVSGGVLNLGGYGFTRTGTVSFTGGTTQSGTLTNDTVAFDAQAGTVSAVLAGAAGLSKTTSGTLTLSGTNTYSGPTTLSAGRLNINSASALGTGTFTISGGSIDNTSGGAITLTGNNVQNWNSDFTFAGSNALNLGTGVVTLSADRIVTVTSSSLTVGGAIGGAFALTKAGAGTLVLSASNARTQATTITAGTISLTGLSGTGALPSASDLANTPITINAGAALLAGGTTSGQNSHLINQDLTLNGGTLATNGVSGNSNYNFAIGGSAKIIAGGGTTSTISASLGVQGTKEFQVGASSTLTVSGLVGNWEGQNWGTINKTGDGTLALTYNGNNYGGLVLTAGTVAVSSGAWSNASGPGYRADFQGNATLQWAAGNTTDISASSKLRIGDGVTASLDTGTNAVTLGTAFVLGTNKTGALTKLGSGTLTISGSNTYVGTTRIVAGGLSIGNAAALQSSTLDLNASDAGTVSAISQDSTLGGLTGSRNLDMLTRTLSVGNNNTSTTYSGTLSNGALTKIGSGTLTLTASNAYAGLTTISAGMLALSGSGSLTSTGTVAITGSGATFDISGAGGNRTIGMLTGTAGSSVALGTNSLTVGDSTTGTFAGGIGGSGGLTKTGAGTLVLSGSNAFSGGVTLTGGQVQIANVNALGTGTFTTNVDANTTIAFNLPASGTIANNITVNKPGSNRTYYFQQNQSNNLTLAGNITVASGNGNQFTLNGVSTGTFTLTGSNSFGADIYTSAGITFRIGGTNAAGSSPTVWRQDASTKMVLLDGASFSRVINSVASYSMETSGSATMAADVYNKDTNTTVVDLPAGAQLTFAANIRAEGGNTTGTFTKTGAGTWVVNNTVNQMTFNVLGGTLQVSSFSGIGPTSTASFLVLDGGTLRYTGAAASTAREFTLGANGGSLDASGSGSAAFTSTAAVSFTGSGNRTLTLTGTNTGNNTLAMAINDNGADKVSLSKTGAGTWVLSGSNGYTGATTIGAGTLSLGNANALAGSTLDMNSGDAGSLAFGMTGTNTYAIGGLTGSRNIATSGSVVLSVGGNGSSGTYSGAVTGAGAFTKVGSGTLTLGAANSYGGATQVNAGVLALGVANALSGSTAVTVGGGVLDLSSFNDAVGSFTITSGSIIGSGKLTAPTYALGGGAVAANLGSGTVTVTANSALDGTSDATAVNLNAGALTLGSGGRFTASTVAVTGSSGASLVLGGNESFGSLAGAANVALGASTLSVGAANTSTTYSGVLSGGGGFTKVGSGTLTLGAANSYGGATQVNAGVLALGVANALSGSTAVTVGGGVLDLSSFKDAVGSVTITSGSIIGSGKLTAPTYALGGGTVAASLGTGTVTVTANSALDGTSDATAVNLNAGALTLGSGGRFTASTVAVTGSSGASLALGGNESFGSLAGAANVALGASTLSVGAANTSTTYSGVLSGGGGFTKVGSGTLSLTGANSFSGNTTVSAGELRIGTGGTTGLLSSSLISVGSGATLAFDRSDNYGGAFGSVISGSGGVRVDSGFLKMTGINTYTGATTVVAGGTLAVNGVVGSGGLTIDSGATLMGSGTIGGLTTIAGIHAPGNSPGIETFTDLTYNTGASVQWELWGNTATNSPLAYDQIVVSGSLNFAGLTSLDLAFTGSASAVAWANSFWGLNQEWLLYDVGPSGATTGFGNLALATANWQDSTGAYFQTVRPDGSFKIEQRGTDIYIVYAAVPEPTGLALAGIGTALAAWGVTRGRRRRRSPTVSI